MNESSAFAELLNGLSINGLSSAWAATSHLEIVAVAFGLVYIVLAAKENSWCWPAAFIGTGTSVILFWDGKIYMESLLNIYYLLMAVYGWWQWRYGGDEQSTLTISRFSIRQHGVAILLVATATLISGYWLSLKTDAALPYLDSFTTWSAVVTTWMVTRKVLENWLYWILINSAAIYLFVERGFLLYAVLYALYIVIAVFGYKQWRHSYNHATR